MAAVTAALLRPIEQQPDRVVQRRHPTRHEPFGDRPDLVQRPPIDEHVVRLLIVELDDRDRRLATLLALLLEEAVEAADHVLLDRGHRPRSVEEEPDVRSRIVLLLVLRVPHGDPPSRRLNRHLLSKRLYRKIAE